MNTVKVEKTMPKVELIEGAKITWVNNNIDAMHTMADWFGGVMAIIEFKEGVKATISAIGDMNVEYTSPLTKEVTTSVDKENSGAFYNVFSSIFANDDELLNAVGDGHLYVMNNNWYDVTFEAISVPNIRISLKTLTSKFNDLSDVFKSPLDSDCINEAIEEVCDFYKGRIVPLIKSLSN